MTHCDLGASGPRAVETKHHNLQSVAAVGALKEAGLDEVVGVTGWEVDPSVGQAVAARGRQTKQGPQPGWTDVLQA